MTSRQDEELQLRAWTVCCDFHDEPIEILAHLKQWEAQYGRTSAGQVILPPPGWKILPFRMVIPNSTHREYSERNGWLQTRAGCSTMTPIFTRPAGDIRAYAVPDPLAGQSK
jgi:hypothetical protein